MLHLPTITKKKPIIVAVIWRPGELEWVPIPIMQGPIDRRMNRAVGRLIERTLRRYDDCCRSVSQSN